MPNDKISAGLATRGATQSGIAKLAGVPATLSALEAASAAVQLRRDNIRERTQAIINHLTEHERKTRDLVAAQTRDVKLSESQRRDMFNSAMQHERTRIESVHGANLAEMLAKQRAARDQAQAAALLFRDPLSLLMRSTLGSGKRSTFDRQLESAGPVAIDDALMHAAATGDKDLAAAAIARLDALDRDQRKAVRIDKREVADHLSGVEHRSAKIALEQLEIAVEEGEHAFAESRGGSVPSSQKIALGIRKRDLETLIKAQPATEDAAA